MRNLSNSRANFALRWKCSQPQPSPAFSMCKHAIIMRKRVLQVRCAVAQFLPHGGHLAVNRSTELHWDMLPTNSSCPLGLSKGKHRPFCSMQIIERIGLTFSENQQKKKVIKNVILVAWTQRRAAAHYTSSHSGLPFTRLLHYYCPGWEDLQNEKASWRSDPVHKRASGPF